MNRRPPNKIVTLAQQLHIGPDPRLNTGVIDGQAQLSFAQPIAGHPVKRLDCGPRIWAGPIPGALHLTVLGFKPVIPSRRQAERKVSTQHNLGDPR